MSAQRARVAEPVADRPEELKQEEQKVAEDAKEEVLTAAVEQEDTEVSEEDTVLAVEQEGERGREGEGETAGGVVTPEAALTPALSQRERE